MTPVSFQPVTPDGYPEELRRVHGSFPGFHARFVRGAGDPGWLLRWETLDQNRDRVRPEPWPEPTLLEVIPYPGLAR